MKEANEEPKIVERVREHLAAAVWSTPDEEGYIDFLTEIIAALTLATKRAEEAEAEAEAWELSSTNWQADCRVAQCERDALRKDAAAISSTMKDAAWLLLHASRQGVNEHRAMVEASCNLTEHIERITAALAVQPKTGEEA
jgi:hypothetical protein